jgi:hypothetical protein
MFGRWNKIESLDTDNVGGWLIQGSFVNVMMLLPWIENRCYISTEFLSVPLTWSLV